MLNIVLTNNGAIAVPGIPKFYFNDADLVRLLHDQDLICAFVQKYGQGVSVGRLGRLGSDGVYREDVKIEKVTDVSENGDLGYYAKV